LAQARSTVSWVGFAEVDARLLSVYAKDEHTAAEIKMTSR
jgi:hypothetical protein